MSWLKAENWQKSEYGTKFQLEVYLFWRYTQILFQCKLCNAACAEGGICAENHFLIYVQLFWYNTSAWRTDGRTDIAGHSMPYTSQCKRCIYASRGKTDTGLQWRDFFIANASQSIQHQAVQHGDCIATTDYCDCVNSPYLWCNSKNVNEHLALT